MTSLASVCTTPAVTSTTSRASLCRMVISLWYWTSAEYLILCHRRDQHFCVECLGFLELLPQHPLRAEVPSAWAIQSVRLLAHTACAGVDRVPRWEHAAPMMTMHQKSVSSPLWRQ